MTRDDPDPERSESVAERLDARHYGDPDDLDPAELHGVAPPCEACGDVEAVDRVDGRDLCGDCLDAER